MQEEETPPGSFSPVSPPEHVSGQNLPLQNVSLWQVDYFRLIIFKKQKTEAEPLTLSLTTLKYLGRIFVLGRELPL